MDPVTGQVMSFDQGNTTNQDQLLTPFRSILGLPYADQVRRIRHWLVTNRIFVALQFECANQKTFKHGVCGNEQVCGCLMKVGKEGRSNFCLCRVDLCLCSCILLTVRPVSLVVWTVRYSQ